MSNLLDLIEDLYILNKSSLPNLLLKKANLKALILCFKITINDVDIIMNIKLSKIILGNKLLR
jgi:hypothetical protein